MLPTPEISVWSSSCRLIPDVRLRDPADERVVVELRVERVPGDVRDLGRQLGAARRRPTARRTSAGRRTAARVPSNRRRRRARTGPAGAARRARRPAGPASGRSCRGGRAGRRRCRAAARGTCRGAGRPRRGARSARRRSRPGRAGHGVRAAGAAPRPRSSGGADDVALQAGADDLDLGQLGHAGQSRSRLSRRRGDARSSRPSVSRRGSPYAVSAASCSASFLERPTPLP